MAKPIPSLKSRVRGVVTIEFAFTLMFGFLPLLLATFSGVLIFAAKQTLALAAAEGARASLRYADSDASRQKVACQVASESMEWLSTFSGKAPDCDSYNAAPLVVVYDSNCGNSGLECIRVTASYDYNTAPFIPGTASIYKWVLGGAISSTAVAQLDGN